VRGSGRVEGCISGSGGVEGCISGSGDMDIFIYYNLKFIKNVIFETL
jgi:hypothetical protein